MDLVNTNSCIIIATLPNSHTLQYHYTSIQNNINHTTHHNALCQTEQEWQRKLDHNFNDVL